MRAWILLYTVCIIYHYGGSDASDVLHGFNGSLRGITDHVLLFVMHIYLSN